MRYKIVKNIELEKKEDKFVNASAQCMLRLLVNRLCVSENANQDEEDNSSINYDFSMYGEELMEMREERGYSNAAFISNADSFVRKL